MPGADAREQIEQESALLLDVLDQAGLLMVELDRLVPRHERSERSRCMNIARTQIELGVLMAIKAVTL